MIETPWMDWMEKNIGELEQTGKPPTDFDRMVFSHTNCPLNEEMLPACAATACAALEQSGYKSPHSARALDFKSYGEPLRNPQHGCIAVFEWSDGSHHVSFYDLENVLHQSSAYFLGGNQGHVLQEESYPLNAVIAWRWPVKA